MKQVSSEQKHVRLPVWKSTERVHLLRSKTIGKQIFIFKTKQAGFESQSIVRLFYKVGIF